MKVSGLIRWTEEPPNVIFATEAEKRLSSFHTAPACEASASMTIHPALWRVAEYSRPGLPRAAMTENGI
jgi:hypothetical protein